MKTNEILQGNRILAEFMGCETESPFGTRRWHTGFSYKECHDSWIDLYEDGDLEFHSSWNWLIPVVEKIESVLDGEVSVLIDGDNCHIYSIGFNFDSFELSKIEAVFSACVKFAEWYKNQAK